MNSMNSMNGMNSMFHFIASDTNIAYKLNITEYLPYILLIIIIIILFIYGYIRVKYGFWAIQPVFHVYNIHFGNAIELDLDNLIFRSPMNYLSYLNPNYGK